MAQRFDDHVDPAGPRGPADKKAKRNDTIGRADPDPIRVAQFAVLTFLIGAGFLLVGYAFS